MTLPVVRSSVATLLDSTRILLHRNRIATLILSASAAGALLYVYMRSSAGEILWDIVDCFFSYSLNLKDSSETSVSAVAQGKIATPPRARSTALKQTLPPTPPPPATFLEAKIFEAQRLPYDDLTYGGVDSDDYDSLNTSRQLETAENSPNHQANVSFSADIADRLHESPEPQPVEEEPLPVEELPGSGEATPKTVENDGENESDDEIQSDPTDFTATAALFSQYAKNLVEKRDYDPSRIHPACVAYKRSWDKQGDVVVVDANPATSSPIFLGYHWFSAAFLGMMFF